MSMSDSQALTNGALNGEESDLRDVVGDLVDRVENLEAENQRLREENEQLEQRLDDVEDDAQWLQEQFFDLEDVVIGEGRYLSVVVDEDASVFDRLDALADDLESPAMEQLESVREKHQSARQNTKRELALIRREVNTLAEETDVDLDKALGDHDDKITQVRKNGVASVQSPVYAKHERAETLLQNLEDWAQTRKDQNGTFAHITAPELKTRLKDTRGERLQSKQLKDVMNAVVDLAADSPRLVKVTKTDGGRNKLAVEVGTR